MKFRDKDGKMFDDIKTKHTEYCKGKTCDSCPLDHNKYGKDCASFAFENSAEAARVMGFEVIDCDFCLWQNTGECTTCKDYSDFTPQDAEFDPEETAPKCLPITREEILHEAWNCVCGEREQDYGSPEDNFRIIANLWIDYLSGKNDPLDIETHDVAAMMALLKIARIASGHAKQDNWIDLAGYAACGGELEGKQCTR